MTGGRSSATVDQLAEDALKEIKAARFKVDKDLKGIPAARRDEYRYHLKNVYRETPLAKKFTDLEMSFLEGIRKQSIPEEQKLAAVDALNACNKDLRALYSGLIAGHPMTEAKVKEAFDKAHAELERIKPGEVEVKPAGRTLTDAEKRQQEARAFIQSQQDELTRIQNKEVAKTLQELQKSIKVQTDPPSLSGHEIMALKTGYRTAQSLWVEVMDVDPITLRQAALGADFKAVPEEEEEDERWKHRIKNIVSINDGVFKKESDKGDLYIVVEQGVAYPSSAIHNDSLFNREKGWKRFDDFYDGLIDFARIKHNKNELNLHYKDQRDFDMKEFERILDRCEKRKCGIHWPLQGIIRDKIFGGGKHFWEEGISEERRKEIIAKIKRINQAAAIEDAKDKKAARDLQPEVTYPVVEAKAKEEALKEKVDELKALPKTAHEAGDVKKLDPAVDLAAILDVSRPRDHKGDIVDFKDPVHQAKFDKELKSIESRLIKIERACDELAMHDYKGAGPMQPKLIELNEASKEAFYDIERKLVAIDAKAPADDLKDRRDLIKKRLALVGGEMVAYDAKQEIKLRHGH